MLTAEAVIHRIAKECCYVNPQGAVGIKLRPAAAIVREYARQYEAVRPARRPRLATPKLV